jgi:hypothetical protein
MPTTAEILDPFTHIKPGQFISKYSDWILFTLLLVFFISVVGIALHKRFQNNRYLKPLIISVGLMLTFGTYFSIYRGWIHLSLEGLGLFGAFLLFVVIFFIIFGLIRGYGVKVSNALSAGFALFYISLWAIIPNILDNINRIFPLLNFILIILFIASIIKVISSFFHHTRQSPLVAANALQETKFSTADEVENETEISKEIKDEKKEQKLLKRKTIKLTKTDIKTVKDIESCLEKMIKLIKEEGNSVDQNEIDQLIYYLRQIAKKEAVLKQGLILIQKHVRSYKRLHQKNIPELEKRLSQTKDKKKQKLIQEEIIYQKRMLQALDYLEKYEEKINSFTQSFNRIVYTAMQRVRSKYPNDALSYLERARHSVVHMKHIYEKQKDLEKYLITVDKKTISDLKNEKNQK